MAKLVVLARDNPKIKELIDKMQLTIKQASDQHDFLQRKMKKLIDETQEKKQAVWREIEEEIDSKGYMPEKKAKDLCLTIDTDVEAVKEATGSCTHHGGKHPLAALFESLIPPTP